MRVAQVIPNFRLGGIQKAGCVLADGLAMQGHDAYVVGAGSGPRFAPVRASGARSMSLASRDVDTTYRALREIDPDVIHIHAHAYDEPLLRRLHQSPLSGHPVIVSTPVFGRPPSSLSTLEQTLTCCVGVYSFYRLCRWLGMSGDSALHKGMFYVPLTPFAPPSIKVSANDDSATVQARRKTLGIGADALVLGRVARCSVDKWHPESEALVNDLLSAFQNAVWLSVGYPPELGLSRLMERWGTRLINIKETTDYDALCRVYSSMDVQVFFSRFGECFASTICEAICLGVPTIALCTPLHDNGQAEQVLDGVTGYLVGSRAQAVSKLRALTSRGLAQLKASSQRYGVEHWHASRVCRDLVAVYEHHLKLSPTPSGWMDAMLAEYDAFASHYRRRVSSAMADRPLADLFWAVAAASAENYTLFALGRSLRRLIRR